MDESQSRFPTIAVLGAGGLLGAEIVHVAKKRDWSVISAHRSDVDAREEGCVLDWLTTGRPDVLVIVAAFNAGVHVNIASPAEMLQDNAKIALASIGAARRAGTPRVLYCSSTAIYPANVPQPYREEDAGNGPLDPSHFGYSAAKLLGLRLCQSIRKQDGGDYTGLLLTNMYGPGQSYDPSRSNVTASLLARFHQAKLDASPEVTIWGTGNARRDLLYVTDAAEAILLMCTKDGPSDGVINIASGGDVSIAELARAVASTTGYDGKLMFDTSKPEGAKQRSIDISRILSLGWRPSTPLLQGLRNAHQQLTA